MQEYFTYNQRLGIVVPRLDKEWHAYSVDEKQEIIIYWEQVRGSIPERIKELEGLINEKQDHLSKEENFELSCILNFDIAELASSINDLWHWYRKNHTVDK